MNTEDAESAEGGAGVRNEAHRSGDRCHLSHESKGVRGEDGAGRSARKETLGQKQGALSVAAARRHLSRKRERGKRQQGAPRAAATASLGGTKTGDKAPSLSPRTATSLPLPPLGGREEKGRKRTGETPVPPKGRKAHRSGDRCHPRQWIQERPRREPCGAESAEDGGARWGVLRVSRQGRARTLGHGEASEER